MIALSALVGGAAIAGAVAALCATGPLRVRLYLMATFMLFLGVASLPLAAAFARPLYVFYVPAVLPMLLALPAVVQLYVKARTCGPDMAPITVPDALLPVVGSLIVIGYWALPNASKNTIFVDGELPPGFLASALTLVTFGLIVLWCVSSAVYLLATTRELRAYRQQLKAIYSNIERYELRWIDALLGMLIGLWAAAAAALMSDNIGPGLPCPGELVFILTAMVLLMLIAFALAPEAEREPAQQQSAQETASAPPEPKPADKYVRSALTHERASQIAGRIEAAMQRDQLHMDPNLSLQKLARHVGASQNLVPQTLNENLGVTFFDYVASWRIHTAKPLIAAGQESVLSIALEVGFNSRSTFYKAFKRETGMTPKAYRDNRR